MNSWDQQNIYLGLVHSPVVNKRGEEVVTSVTNLDIHDIARTARTYGIKNYFIITPLEIQHQLLERILYYWESDESNEYNPDRQDALSFIIKSYSIEAAISTIESREGKKPLIAVTAAGMKNWDGEPEDLIQKAQSAERPVLVLFGTGWGLARQVLELADYSLAPLHGNARDGYNHLSVRSAVAIYCDRLLGKR